MPSYPNDQGNPAGAIPVSSVSGYVASDGVIVYPDNLAQVLAYDGSGNLSTVTVVAPSGTYRQTLTYTAGKVTNISTWVKQ